jgi:hypothetical protein
MIKKLSMYDMAMYNIRSIQRLHDPVDVKEGDIVTVVDPWVIGESYQGLAVEVNSENMMLYHNDIQAKITWPRRVKCHIIKL